MKNQILVALFCWAIVSSVAFAADSAAMKSRDLAGLKRTLHGANQTQLAEKYQAYADEMASYVADLPSCLNVWLNANEMKMGKEAASKAITPETMTARADMVMKGHLDTANAAKRSLIKITSAAALKQVDLNHKWDLPANLSQVKPDAGITEVKQLSPRILRQIPKLVP